MNRNRILVIVVAAVAALAGSAFAFLVLAPGEPPELEAGTLLSQPRPLPEFEMVADDQSAFTRADFQGHWSLVFFGFTHCPDVCPNTLFMLDRVVEQVESTGSEPPRVVFVSVDTERDTPAEMAEYVAYFNPDFVGITGDGDNLQKLTRAMSVAYEFRPPEDGVDDDYTVVHSSTVLAIDPQGRLRTIFTPPLSADAIAADMGRLISN